MERSARKGDTMFAGGDPDKPTRNVNGHPVFYDYYSGAEAYRQQVERETRRPYKITASCPPQKACNFDAEYEWMVEPDTDCGDGQSYFARIGGTRFFAQSCAERLTTLTGQRFTADCTNLWLLPDYCKVKRSNQ